MGHYSGYDPNDSSTTDTPFDMFDNDCHDVGQGLGMNKKEIYEDEEQLKFLINMSEHVGRPEDMLMFLGEYFKQNLIQTLSIEKQNLAKSEGSTMQKLDKFFMSSDIMNFFGTACKMYIENLRQELRISIALWRNPTFHDAAQREYLAANIRNLQISIVKRCAQLYKMIDFLHDKRPVVPLQYISKQPAPSILNALFCKMKADNLRYIYECLSGDNGLMSCLNEHQ